MTISVVSAPSSPYHMNMNLSDCVQGTNGQYNDEYDDNAHEKMSKKHATQYSHHAAWRSTPSIANLPGSCDDEFSDDHVYTAVDMSMIRNASSNALTALVQKEIDSEVDVTDENCLRPLDCKAQEYAWGKIGPNSLVARLKAAQSADFNINASGPYAELWIGTHPNGMSNILLPPAEGAGFNQNRSIPLVDYVQSNPEMHLGIDGFTKPSNEFDLTFLFKVLSIEKVLSIQAHPDKFLAAQLHTERPHVYKDPNHKPEMAVALTDDFEAMSGFRPIAEIASNMLEYPEFTELVGLESKESIIAAVEGRLYSDPKTILKALFRAYMKADDGMVKKQLNRLIPRLAAKANPTSLDKLLIKLARQFPGDSGVFAPIIFNYLKLKIGDAFFIGANEPHAYIQGEILECMACSDNVVRAGLTPKLKDVETLVKMLTYKTTIPEVTRGRRIDHCTVLHVPPVEDFAIEVIKVPAGSQYMLDPVRSPSVILTLSGSATLEQGTVPCLPVSFGKAAFMSANTSATVITDAMGSGVHLVRALSNVHL